MNGRIYPQVNYFNCTLNIRHDEMYVYARYNPEFTKTIINKGQARNIRKKTGFNKVITGDVFYDKLSWLSDINGFGVYGDASTNTGMAIMREKKTIWYQMPGTPEGIAERKVLTEKYKNKIILTGIASRFELMNK